MFGTSNASRAAATVISFLLVFYSQAHAQERPENIGGKGVGDLVRPSSNYLPDRQATATRYRFRDPDTIVDPGPGVGASIRIETAPGDLSRVIRPGASDPDIIDPGLGVGAAIIVQPGPGVGSSAQRGESGGEAVPHRGTGSPPSIIILRPGPSSQTDVVQRSQSNPREDDRLTPYVNPLEANRRPFPIRPSQGVSGLGFKDLDSGLRDCDLVFEELAARSPFCRTQDRDPGQRCERFSFNQFPEVVKIITVLTSGETRYCTGTMISFDWALTAAHCFLGDDAAAVENRRLQRPSDADIDWRPGAKSSYFTDVVVEANNAKMITDPWQRLRRAGRVVVSASYAGRYGDRPFFGDIALVKIDDAFKSWEVEPAILTKDAASTATLAGFGYSNANGGTFGQFGVTWPPPLSRDEGSMAFRPSTQIRGAFCQGDSGGPVFAGRHRGCKVHDISPEQRPRPVQGVISFNQLGAGTGSTLEQRQSARCLNASSMVMQDVTTVERRRWICETTVNTVGGCD